MTHDQAPADLLPDALREPIGSYVSRLRQICGDELLGLTFYGRLEAPRPGQSAPLRNAAVFRRVDLQRLSEIAREGKHFGRSHIAAPWALTPELIEDSRDTFPLELLEIAQQHVTVHGHAYFDQLEFAPADVRLQCERELKVIEIQLQRGLLTAAGDERSLGKMASHLAEALLRVLRGMAWLGGDREARSAYGLVETVERFIGHPIAGVRRVMDDSGAVDWAGFSAFHGDVRSLREAVDKLP